MSEVETYTLQILVEDPPAEEGSAVKLEMREQRMRANLPAMLEQTEENLTDLLPEGFSAKITRWDES